MINRRETYRYVLPFLAASSVLRASPAEKPPLKFGVIADPQYADADSRGSRFYRNSLKKLRLAIDQLNQQPLDFVITLGDTIDRDISSFDNIIPLYRRSQAPVKFLLGNHDFEVADGEQPKVLGKLSMKAPYYSFQENGWRIVVLDGTEMSTYRHQKGTKEHLAALATLEKLKQQKRPNAQSWNGGVSNTQLQWLSQTLAKSEKAGESVIVCNHFPLLPNGDAHNLWNADEVLSLIRKHRGTVKAYFNGHNHKGRYLQDQGTHYLNFKGMVETAETSAFATVTCLADRILVHGYEAEPSRNLTDVAN